MLALLAVCRAPFAFFERRRRVAFAQQPLTPRRSVALHLIASHSPRNFITR